MDVASLMDRLADLRQIVKLHTWKRIVQQNLQAIQYSRVSAARQLLDPLDETAERQGEREREKETPKP